MLVWSAGHPTSLEAAGDELVPPRIDLPFADGATWIVAAPAEGRRPDRATAWAVNFKPAGEASVEGAFDDIASIAERCRFADCAHADEPGCAGADHDYVEDLGHGGAGHGTAGHGTAGPDKAESVNGKFVSV